MSDYCFQPSKSFPIIQENQQQKPNELKFKIESVGIHFEDDDDLDMCPARIRPSWPKKIIPWWVASHPDEKPPYSYATLIAHAILASKDGRLTLSDIYAWISKNYPTFSVGNGGWQNSIRHNLSLNRKWFYKITRRPTQANPGRGCYWTLIAGTEHIFIDNLTQEGGQNRKHHDVGLTAELSIGQRRGACFYSHNNSVAPTTPTTPAQTPSASPRTAISLDTPPPTPTKPLHSPLYTTFRMVDMTLKPHEIASAASVEDSDNDSGVDVGNANVERKHLTKRRRTSTAATTATTTTTTTTTATPVMALGIEKLHVDNSHQSSMLYDTPKPTCISPFGDIPYEINNWVEHPLAYTNQQTSQPQLQPQRQPQPQPQAQAQAQAQRQPQPLPKQQQWIAPTQQPTTTWKSPITIQLNDKQVTRKRLPFDSNHLNFTAHHSTNPIFSHLYPSQPPQHQPTSYYMPLQSQYQLSQFIYMQDILYS